MAKTIILLFNKPYGVLSQFSLQKGVATLTNYIAIPEIYPIGRLDKDSEGLLVLTNDGKLQHRGSDPRYQHEKTYWVQVEGIPDEAAMMQLTKGILLNDGFTKPAKAKIIKEPTLWPRLPPIRYRKLIPTCWLEIKLTEGRNRQIRRMTAAVGFPTLRLVRVASGAWSLGELQPGEYKKIHPFANSSSGS